MDEFKNVNTPRLPFEGEQELVDYIPVPAKRYEELVRAETELGILEAAIKGKLHYSTEDVLDAIRTAKAKSVQTPAAVPADSKDTPDA